MLICQLLKSNHLREHTPPSKIAFSAIQQPLTLTWNEVSEKARPAFEKYIAKVFKSVQDRQRQEEDAIMKS